MSNQDWTDIARNISESVQRAVDTQDFSQLNKAVQDGLNAATRTAGRTVNDFKRSFNTPPRPRPQPNVRNRQASGYRQAPQRPAVQKSSAAVTKMEKTAKLKKITGLVLTIAGSIVLFPLLLAALIDFISGQGAIGFVASLLFAPILIWGLIRMYNGKTIEDKVKRYRLYQLAMGNKQFITIAELAKFTEQDEETVAKDLLEMLSKNMYEEGHLSLDKKYFFTSNEMYQHYVNLPPVPASDQPLKSQAKVDQEKNEVSELVAQGQDYIRQLHHYNDLILDTKVSDELDKMELILNKIFAYVEEHPESAGETAKLMKYYLPTTMNLLDSYRKLSTQPVQGENILKSIKEIEETIGTLNKAFERLFDNLYQDQSMDIASDISVLNSMLAQEGLTGEEMKQKEYV